MKTLAHAHPNGLHLLYTKNHARVVIVDRMLHFIANWQTLNKTLTYTRYPSHSTYMPNSNTPYIIKPMHDSCIHWPVENRGCETCSGLLFLRRIYGQPQTQWKGTIYRVAITSTISYHCLSTSDTFCFFTLQSHILKKDRHVMQSRVKYTVWMWFTVCLFIRSGWIKIKTLSLCVFSTWTCLIPDEVQRMHALASSQARWFTISESFLR